MKDKKNIVLADGPEDEMHMFIAGLNTDSEIKYELITERADGLRINKFSELKRYLKYFYVAWKYFVKRKQFDVVMGWQQFYALIYCFFCEIFGVKKLNTIVALNFTYKPKGKLYRWFMGKCVSLKYLDYIHVLSYEYAELMSKEFSFPMDRILVTPFGVNDCYEEYSKLPAPNGFGKETYALAIGRSNRDFDFLIKAWKNINFPLVVISDTYTGTNLGNNNVIIKNNIAGEASFPWIANCKMIIIPLKDPTICSGDTVLLNAMACKKIVVVTAPSTLAEMYIRHGENGYALKKDNEEFARNINEILKSNADIAANARKSFLNKFSRKRFGMTIAETVGKKRLG